MAAARTAGRAAASPCWTRSLARTDGIPLFVEELVEALLAEDAPLDGPLPDIAVPASLHDMLMARLDRLPEAKEVAQIAACIGREFDRDAARAGRRRAGSGRLGAALDRLCAAEILIRGGEPEPPYAFKHALLRDAAYESLLLSRRRALHAASSAPGAALDGRPPWHPSGSRTMRPPPSSGPEALHFWAAAGKAAMDRASYTEAIGLFGRALEAGARMGRRAPRSKSR